MHQGFTKDSSVFGIVLEELCSPKQNNPLIREDYDCKSIQSKLDTWRKEHAKLPKGFTRGRAAYGDHAGSFKASDVKIFALYHIPAFAASLMPDEPLLHLTQGCNIYRRMISGITPKRADWDTFKNDIESFGSEFFEYYQRSTLNVHLLVHYPRAIENWGAVDNFSAFQFEGFIGYLQSLIFGAHSYDNQIEWRLHARFTRDIALDYLKKFRFDSCYLLTS
jgi:hypothetical protein